MSIDDLIRGLRDPRPAVRGDCAGDLQDAILDHDHVTDVTAGALEKLFEFLADAATEDKKNVLDLVWFVATQAVSELEDEPHAPAVLAVLRANEPVLVTLARSDERDLRIIALATLSRIGIARTELFESLVADSDPLVRAAALLALRDVGARDQGALFAASMADGDARVVTAAGAAYLAFARDADATLTRRAELATLVDRIAGLEHDLGWFDVRAAATLRPSTPAPAPLEHATVVFAGEKMLIVEHATRGRFTFKVATGLRKGDVVQVGDFIVFGGSPRALALAWNDQARAFDARGEIV